MDVFKSYFDQIAEPRHGQILTMFEELWPRFSTAPASTKYHGAYKGGLVNHTLRVIETSIELYNFYKKFKNLPNLESVIFCALVHDVGKIGTKDQHAYIYDGEKFEYNKTMLKIDHELLTLFWLNEYGIKMTEEEMAAIYYHAGPYVEAYKKTTETDLLMILNAADNLAAKILKT